MKQSFPPYSFILVCFYINEFKVKSLAESQKVLQQLSYLEDKNIELISFGINYDSAKAEVCLACFCRTGNVLQVEVEVGRKQKMRRIGFYP